MKISLSIITIAVTFILSGWWLNKGYEGQPIQPPNTLLAQHLLDEAENLVNTESVTVSMLLAVESMRRAPSERGAAFLRQQLAVSGPTIKHTWPDTTVQKVIFSSDGRWLASQQTDNSVQLWQYDVMQAQLTPIWKFVHHARVTAMTFGADNEWFATSSDDGTVYVWSLNLQQLSPQYFHGEAIKTLAFSPDEQWLVAGSENEAIYIWSLPAMTLKKFPHKGAVSLIQFSPDGQWLATVSDHLVRIWEMPSLIEIPLPLVHVQAVTSLAFSANHPWLATADWTGQVRLWELHPRSSIQPNPIIRPLAAPIPHVANFWTLLAFSADGQYLAVSGEKLVHVWQIQPSSIAGLTVEPQLTLSYSHTDWVSQISFSPQGYNLTSASWDKSVQIWNIMSGQQVSHLPHQDRVWQVAMHPNMVDLVTASGQTLQLWQINSADTLSLNAWNDSQLIAATCHQVGYNNLTQADWSRYMGAEAYRLTCPQ